MIYFLTVNYHSAEQIGTLIASFPDPSECPYQLVVVNNSADDLQLEKLRGEAIVILESPENIGFGRACNLGMAWIFERDPQALVWAINPDARLAEDLSLRSLQQLFEVHDRVAILGTAIYTHTGELWFGGGTFDPASGTIASGDLDDLQEGLKSCDWVSGCSTIVNFKRFEQCPQFDPAFFLYYEDFDFCQRYRLQGYEVASTNQFAVIHHPLLHHRSESVQQAQPQYFQLFAGAETLRIPHCEGVAFVAGVEHGRCAVAGQTGDLVW